MTFKSVRNLYAYHRAHDNTADEPSTAVDDWGAMIDTDGKCAGSDVPQKWHPLPGFTEAEYDQYAEWACRGCPVMAACGMYAITTGQSVGVWGGTAQHRLHQAALERAQARQADLDQAVDLEHAARLVSVL